MDKFDRNYVLLIEKGGGAGVLRITRPFTIEFEIHRNSQSSQNVGKIRVYNLNANNRKQIRRNYYDTDDVRTFQFLAGYGKNLSLAFKGNITQAWSIREGNNMITEIECFDGGQAYLNAVTDQQFPSGTSQKSIIDSIVDTMKSYGVDPGSVGSYPGTISRGNSYSGNPIDLLSQITGEGFFIDSGKANCLNANECIDTAIPLINAKSGLLGTPLLEQQYIMFDMLFEPSLQVGQLIRLESETDELFNGTHKVLTIKHRGIISEAVSGNAVTTVSALPGQFTPVLGRRFQ